MTKTMRILEILFLLIFLCCLAACGGSSSSSTNSQQTPTPASVIATIPVGIYPGAVGVNPTTNRIYVLNGNRHSEPAPSTVSVIDGVSNSVIATVPVGVAPSNLAVNPVTNKIYVTNYDGQTMTVIDGATNSTVDVNVGVAPGDLAINTLSNKIYVGVSAYLGTVTVVDGATNNTANIPGIAFPGPLTVDSGANKIYVISLSNNSSSLWVVDGATNGTSRVDVGYGNGPVGIAFNSATNKVYLSGSLDGAPSWVTIVDGATLATSRIDTVSDSSGPWGPIAVNSTTNRIYVPHQSGAVAVIDGTTLGISMVTAGQTPHFVTVDAAANQIYVLNGGTSIFSSPPGSTVTVIDGATNATTTLNVGELPSAAAVNPVTHRVYVTNSCGNDSTCTLAGAQTGTVSVIEAAH